MYFYQPCREGINNNEDDGGDGGGEDLKGLLCAWNCSNTPDMLARHLTQPERQGPLLPPFGRLGDLQEH